MNVPPSVKPGTIKSRDSRVCFVHEIVTRSSAEREDRAWHDELWQGRAGQLLFKLSENLPVYSPTFFPTSRELVVL